MTPSEYIQMTFDPFPANVRTIYTIFLKENAVLVIVSDARMVVTHLLHVYVKVLQLWIEPIENISYCWIVLEHKKLQHE